MGFKRLEDGVISGTTLLRPFLGASSLVVESGPMDTHFWCLSGIGCRRGGDGKRDKGGS